MSHKDAPPETTEQARMREFYTKRSVQCGWSMAKDGRYHAAFANDAWAAWQEAQQASDSASPARCAHNYIENGLTHCLMCGKAIATDSASTQEAEK